VLSAWSWKQILIYKILLKVLAIGLHNTGLCNYSNSQSFHVISFAAECAGLYCPNLQLAAHRAVAFINYLTQVTFSSPAIILVQSRSVETTALQSYQ